MERFRFLSLFNFCMAGCLPNSSLAFLFLCLFDGSTGLSSMLSFTHVGSSLMVSLTHVGLSSVLSGLLSPPPQTHQHGWNHLLCIHFLPLTLQTRKYKPIYCSFCVFFRTTTKRFQGRPVAVLFVSGI